MYINVIYLRKSIKYFDMNVMPWVVWECKCISLILNYILYNHAGSGLLLLCSFVTFSISVWLVELPVFVFKITLVASREACGILLATYNASFD